MRAVVIFFAIVSALAIAAASTSNQSALGSQLVNTLAVDVDPTGNAPTSIGAIDSCASINLGDSIDIDVVVDAIPPYIPPPPGSIDSSGGLAGFGFNILYDATVVQVTAKSSLYPTSLLGADPVSAITSFSSVLPDTDGDWHVVELDSNYPAESGAGTILRFRLTGLAMGSSDIRLGDTTGGDFDGVPDLYGADTATYSIQNLLAGRIVVGDVCPAPPPPPPEGASITGRITDSDGNPIIGATVGARPSDCCSTHWEVLTVADGTYAFFGLPPGDYIVGADKDGFFSGCYLASDCSNGSPPVHVVADVTTVGVDIVLQPVGRISGHVFDTSGYPIAGAYVYPNNSVAGPPPPEPPASAITGADGSYLLGMLHTGSYPVIATAEGFAPQCYSLNDTCSGLTLVQAVQGDTTTGIDFALKKLPKIEGTVLDTHGVPVVGATVAADTTASCCPRLTTTTDANGRYSLEVTLAGDYVVTAEADGFFRQCYDRQYYYCLTYSPVRADLDSITSEINFVLTSPGAISGRVTDIHGTAIAGATVSATGYPCCSPLGGQATSDAEGYFLIENLRPGPYVVSFWVPGFKPDCYGEPDCLSIDPLSVLSGETTTAVNLTLKRYPRVIGHVTDTSGQPIAGAYVASFYGVCCQAGTPIAFTDANGDYVLDSLNGVYPTQVMAIADGYRTQCFDHAQDWTQAKFVDLHLDEDVTGVDFSLEPGHDVLDLSLGSVAVQPGQTFTLPLVRQSDGCRGPGFVSATISFDPSWVAGVSCRATALCFAASDRVSFALSNQYGPITGQTAELTFTVAPSASGIKTLGLLIDQCFGVANAECRATNGQVTIVDPSAPPPSISDCRAMGVPDPVACRRELFRIWWRLRHGR